MKYWKLDNPKSHNFSGQDYKAQINTPETFDLIIPISIPYIEITKEEYDLYKIYNVKTPNNDPTTGQPWSNEIVKQNWIKVQLWNEAVKHKADKGQEVENALELNDAIKSYTDKLLRGINFEIFGILGELAKNPTDITIDKRFNDKMKEWKAYNGLISNIESFERSIAIATNTDTTHPIDPREESVFVGVLTQIASQEQSLWLEITKILKVEETYEPEMVKNEYIKLQQAVHNHLHPIDPNIVNGKDTLAHELGGTPTK